MRKAIHRHINIKLAAETSDPLAYTTTVFLGNLEMKRSGSIALRLHTRTGYNYFEGNSLPRR